MRYRQTLSARLSTHRGPSRNGSAGRSVSTGGVRRPPCEHPANGNGSVLRTKSVPLPPRALPTERERQVQGKQRPLSGGQSTLVRADRTGT